MNTVDQLKKDLEKLQSQRKQDQTIKNLKKQIKVEKFKQTKSGKIFNKIADIGDYAGKKLMAQPQGKKKKTKARVSVEEIMARLPQ